VAAALAVAALAVVTAACSSSHHTANRSRSTASTTTSTAPGAVPGSVSAQATVGGVAVTTTPTAAPASPLVPAESAPPTPPIAGDGVIAGQVLKACNGAPGSGCGPTGPVMGVSVVVTRGSQTLGTTNTDADGRYRIAIPAGVVTVTEQRNGQSRTTQVGAGDTVVVNFVVA